VVKVTWADRVAVTVGYALVVVGVCLWSLSAGLVVAGSLLLAGALWRA
jgi:hypothetical protein